MCFGSSYFQRKRNSKWASWELNISDWQKSSYGVCGSVVGCGTMLQTGMSRVLFPMKSLDPFQFTYNFQQHYEPWVDSASNLPGRKANNRTAISEPTVYSRGGLDIPQTHGPPRPVTGTAFTNQDGINSSGFFVASSIWIIFVAIVITSRTVV
jgi:hypothetical protein